MKKANIISEIEKISYDALQVIAVLKTTKGSCSFNDFIDQEMALDIAINIQQNLIEKINNLRI